MKRLSTKQKLHDLDRTAHAAVRRAGAGHFNVHQQFCHHESHHGAAGKYLTRKAEWNFERERKACI